MYKVPALFAIILIALIILIIGSVFSEPIAAVIRRRAPEFGYEGWTLMLVGLLVITGFSVGLVVMYLLLRP